MFAYVVNNVFIKLYFIRMQIRFQIPVYLALVIQMLTVQERVLRVPPLPVPAPLHLKEME